MQLTSAHDVFADSPSSVLAWPNQYPPESDSLDLPTPEELCFIQAISLSALKEGFQADHFIEPGNNRAQFVFNVWAQQNLQPSNLPRSISSTVPNQDASHRIPSPPLPTSSTYHQKTSSQPPPTALDIISQGMLLKGEAKAQAEIILQQQVNKQNSQSQKGSKAGGAPKTKGKAYAPFSKKHKNAVRRLINKLRQELADYATQHNLNLSQIGALLSVYLEVEGFTSWQAFLSLRGLARKNCKLLFTSLYYFDQH